MKPAWEPIILARKPGPMRELGIDSCRIGISDDDRADMEGRSGASTTATFGNQSHDGWEPTAGRWPANLILECTCDETREGTARTGTAVRGHGGRGATHGIYGAGMGAYPVDTPDMTYSGPNGKEPVRIHTDPNCPCAMLDGQTGTLHAGMTCPNGAASIYGNACVPATKQTPTFTDSGGASRFFYCAKASRSERNAGCEGMEERLRVDADKFMQQDRRSNTPKTGPVPWQATPVTNHHPTVKPLALMRWLVKLVAQPGDVVLDPFMGSGTTGVACVMEGREFIGVERELEYLEISRRRIEHASAQGRLPLDESPPLPPVAGRPT